MAWLEYQDSRDGAVFTHASTARLGFENAFASLPRAAGSRSARSASNFTDSSVVVKGFKSGGKAFRGLIAQPGEVDQPMFERWINSPALDNDKLVSDPAAADPIDLLAISGHGSNGGVWGDGSRDYAELNLSSAFEAHAAEARSGRLKCLMVPSCNNVHEDMAPAWLPLFNHDQPVHVLLGYHQSYTGGAIGARVMAKFIDAIVKDRRIPLVEAWRVANEGVRVQQPWAALVAEGAEGMNLEDWVAGKLPPLSRVQKLSHFDWFHPAGERAKLIDENFEVRWVMADGTIIDRSNNIPAETHVGVFDGQPGTVRIRAKRPAATLKKGQEAYLLVYRYRASKKLHIDDLLVFDPALLKPHPDTGQPVVTPEKGKSPRDEVDNVDAFRVIVPADTMELELGFTIKAAATKNFDADGPGGTHGRFFLDFFHDFVLHELDPGRFIVAANLGGNSFAATAGALLRK